MSRPQSLTLFLILAFGPATATAQNSAELSSQAECLEDQGRVRLRIDPYGAVGSAVSIGGGAHFDPGVNEAGVDWVEESTVFESMSFVCFEDAGGRFPRGTWLESGRYAGQRQAFNVEDGVVTSQSEWSNVTMELRAELMCNVLRECWTFTNNSDRDLETVALTHYIDGDLFYVGGFGNDFGGTRPGPPRTVFEFDNGDDPEAPTTFIGLSSSDPGDPYLTSWEVGEFSEQRGRIDDTGGGCTVLRNDLNRDAIANADLNDDLITDSGFDVTISLRFDIGPLAQGARSREVCLDITWGVGFACGDPDEDGICSNEDNCPFIFNPPQQDGDEDGIGNVCDNCPRKANWEQVDRDDDGIGDECDKYVCQPTNDGVEECDAIDNDCNGRVDDLDPAFVRCPTGLPGVCASGVPTCQAGEILCVSEHREGGREEVCNMLDDDCDGQVDEGKRNRCGRCGPEPAEGCNGVDDDCNGRVDDGDICGVGYACIDGACRAPCAAGECSGSEHCVEGYCGGPCYGTECPEGLQCTHAEGGGTSGCVDPCAEVDCPAGTVCDFLGRCGPCEAVGCPPGQTCAGADRCIPDPCDGVRCDEGWACVDGRCRGSCAGVSCPMGESCRAGECVDDPCGGVSCPMRQTCGAGATCVLDECQAVSCGPGEACHRGHCIADPCIVARCPDGEACRVACIQGDCFARCWPDWAGESVVDDAPPPTPLEGDDDDAAAGGGAPPAAPEPAAGGGDDGDGDPGGVAEADGDGATADGDQGAGGGGVRTAAERVEPRRRDLGGCAGSCATASGGPGTTLVWWLPLIAWGARRRRRSATIRPWSLPT